MPPPAAAAAAVAPPLDAAARADAQVLLQRLEWQVLRRLDGLLQGDYRTLWRGAGVDLADLREYQHHDDVRHIDWNVTARLQQPYVRQFLEDRDLTAWFVVDRSASIDFGSAGTSKLGVADAFVAALARVLTRHGNRVGALFYGDRIEATLPPRAGRAQVLELLRRLRLPRPPRPAAPAAPRARWWRRRSAAPPPPPPDGTALAEMIDAAASAARRRALVFVVSDFIGRPGWPAALGRLALRHEVVAVRVMDPAEAELPAFGLVTVEDAETGEQLLVDTADPAFRRRHAAAAAAQQAALLQTLAATGADVLELATDDDLMAALMRFADLRRQRARLPAPRRFPATHRRAEAAVPSTNDLPGAAA